MGDSTTLKKLVIQTIASSVRHPLLPNNHDLGG